MSPSRNMLASVRLSHHPLPLDLGSGYPDSPPLVASCVHVWSEEVATTVSGARALITVY